MYNTSLDKILMDIQISMWLITGLDGTQVLKKYQHDVYWIKKFNITLILIKIIF